jgi:hypothetical protein
MVLAALTAAATVAALLAAPQIAYADTNLALNKPVTVSSTDDPNNAAGDAVDGNTGSGPPRSRRRVSGDGGACRPRG